MLLHIYFKKCILQKTKNRAWACLAHPRLTYNFKEVIFSGATFTSVNSLKKKRTEKYTHFLHFIRYCFSIPSGLLMWTVSSGSQISLWACLLPSSTRAPSLRLNGSFSIGQSVKFLLIFKELQMAWVNRTM